MEGLLLRFVCFVGWISIVFGTTCYTNFTPQSTTIWDAYGIVAQTIQNVPEQQWTSAVLYRDDTLPVSGDFYIVPGQSVSYSSAIYTVSFSSSNQYVYANGSFTLTVGSTYTFAWQRTDSIGAASIGPYAASGYISGSSYTYGSWQTSPDICGQFCFNTPPSPSTSPSRTPSTSPTPSKSPTPSVTPSRTPSVTPSPVSPSSTPSSSITPSPSISPSVSPSITPSVIPSITPSVTPSISPSASPSLGATNSVTPSSSVTSTPSISPSSSSSPSATTPSATSTPSVPATSPSPVITTVSASPSSSSSPSSGSKSSKKKDNSVAIGAAVGSVGGVLFLSLAALAFLKFKKRDKHQQASIEMSPPSNDPQNSDFYAASAPANETVTQYSSTQDTDYMRYPTNESQNNNNTKTVSPKPKVYAANNVNVAYEDVSMDHKLGQGAFGVVYKGKWRGGVVAIKQIQNVTEAAIQEFLKEAELMRAIRPHSNVVQFLGICEDPLLILTEFMEQGSLYNFLRTTKGILLDMTSQIELMKGIASGMYHLASEGIAHRDLAARNILLSTSLIPKISDFGMSRLVGDNGGGKTDTSVGPLKWMAPESLSKRVYSEKSDVWSFGIVCIEILTRADPYPNLDSIQVTLLIATGQAKPEFPKGTPADLKKILELCFEYEPENRPDFKHLCRMLTPL